MNPTIFLKQFGLNDKEITLYLLGLSIGTQATSIYAKSVKWPRSSTQVILSSLVEKGLMSKTIKAHIQYFTSHAPGQIHALLEQKKEDLHTQMEDLQVILPQLLSLKSPYATLPHYTYYEGEDGVKAIYKDILDEKKDFLLFRSPYDKSSVRFREYIEKMIDKFVMEGMHSRMIAPKVEGKSIETSLTNDKKRNVTRRFIPTEQLQIPAQIIIYGEKVCIMSLRESVRGYLIQDKDTADTMRILFEYVWNKAETEHTAIINNK